MVGVGSARRRRSETGKVVARGWEVRHGLAELTLPSRRGAHLRRLPAHPPCPSSGRRVGVGSARRR
eukprot:6137713-Pleurochrysis_carterae.AAC.1